MNKRSGIAATVGVGLVSGALLLGVSDYFGWMQEARDWFTSDAEGETESSESSARQETEDLGDEIGDHPANKNPLVEKVTDACWKWHRIRVFAALLGMERIHSVLEGRGGELSRETQRELAEMCAQFVRMGRFAEMPEFIRDYCNTQPISFEGIEQDPDRPPMTTGEDLTPQVADPGREANNTPRSGPVRPQIGGRGAAPGGGAPNAGGPGDDIQDAQDEDCEERKGSISGDPHISTLDGLHYTTYSVGEFVALSSTTDDFQIQIRTAPTSDDKSPACANASSVAGIAMRMGNKRVAVYAKAPNRIFIDGEPSTLVVRKPVVVDQGAMVFSATSGEVGFAWDDGSLLMVRWGHRDWLDLDIILSPPRYGHVEGLLGDSNGEPGNDLRVPGSDQVVESVSRLVVEADFVRKWQVNSKTSLFDYADGESIESMRDETFALSHPLERLTSKQRTHADAVCQAEGITDPTLLEACALDVTCLGDEAALRRLHTKPPVPLKLRTRCESDEFNNHNYLFCIGSEEVVENKAQPWPEHHARCQALGMDLVAIGSKAEDDFVFNRAKEMRLPDSPAPGAKLFAMGLASAAKDASAWSTDEPVTYENWATPKGGGAAAALSPWSAPGWVSTDVQPLSYICEDVALVPEDATLKTCEELIAARRKVLDDMLQPETVRQWGSSGGMKEIQERMSALQQTEEALYRSGVLDKECRERLKQDEKNLSISLGENLNTCMDECFEEMKKTMKMEMYQECAVRCAADTRRALGTP